MKNADSTDTPVMKRCQAEFIHCFTSSQGNTVRFGQDDISCIFLHSNSPAVKPKEPPYRLDRNDVSELLISSLPAITPHELGTNYIFIAYLRDNSLFCNCYMW